MSARRPDAACLITRDGAAVSFGELWGEIEKLVFTLVGWGVHPRSRVVHLLPARESNVVALLSTMSCSACVPLDPEIPLDDLGGILSRVGASAVILPEAGCVEQADLARSLGVSIVRLHPAVDNPFSVELHRQDLETKTARTAAERREQAAFPAGDDKALLLFTSGTKAAPKLVGLSHGQLLTAASNIASVLKLDGSDRQLSVMPLHHIHGLSTLLSSLLSGGSTVCTRGFIGGDLTGCLRELAITWYSASPSIHRQLMRRRSGEYAGAPAESRLRFVRSASEKMPQALCEEIEARLGVPVIESYGMTEASPQIASNGPAPRDRKPGSVGRAAGPEVRIVDTDGKSLPCGAIGEIAVRGDSVVSRYEDSDIDTRQAFVDGWLRTGDEGYLDEEGFLFVTGRLDDVVNRGGFKVSPAKVEQVLNSHPAVAESVVFAVPDNRLGQEVSAAIVPARRVAGGYCDTTQYLAYKRTIEALQEDLRLRLSRPEIPKSYYVVDEVPLGPTGKRKRALPRRFLAMIVPDPDPLEEVGDRDVPLSPTLYRLTGMWKDVLGRDVVKTSDNFFDAGGDSLVAMELLARVRDVFAVDLPPSSLFHNPSISSLSRAIGACLSDRAAGGERGTPPFGQSRDAGRPTYDAPRPGDGHQLSGAQKQIWFMSQGDAAAAYHMSASLYLFGDLSVGTLETALNEIVARHEALRIGIRSEDGVARQFVRGRFTDQLELLDVTELPLRERGSTLRKIAFEAHNAPFDLSRDSLVRLKLVRVDDRQHLLLVTLHHIVCDAWSISILYRELSSIYSSIVSGKEYRNTELPPRFMAYVESLSSGAAGKESSVRYWREKLFNCPAECRFPPDHPAPGRLHYEAGVVRTRIGDPSYRQIRSAARRHGVTLYVFLLAVFETLLHRCSGQTEIVIGTPVAGRELPSTRDMVGCLANTVVLRGELSEDMVFEDFLQKTSMDVRSTLDHADVSLMEMIRNTDVPRRHGINPFFQTMFVLQEFPDSPLGTLQGGATRECLPDGTVGPDDLLLDHGFELAEGIRAFPWQQDIARTKFDLALYLKPGREGMHLAWHFRTCWYERETIERIAGYFTQLAAMVVDTPSLPVGSYRLSADGPSGRWGIGEAAQYPLSSPETTFVDQFRLQVERNPRATAVVAGERQWTYAELDRVSDRVAGYLQRLGIGPNSVVGIVVHRRIELFALVIGVWKSGAVYLPCDPDYPAERIAHVLDNADAVLLIGDLESVSPGGIGEGGVGYVDLDTAWPAILAEEPRGSSGESVPGAPAYVIYTSGSSGRPEKTVVKQGGLGYYCRAMKEVLGLSVNDRYLHSASISFSSSIRQLAVPLAGGSSIVLADRTQVRDPERLLHLICSCGVTVVDLVPSNWSLLVRFLESRGLQSPSCWRGSPPRLMLSASEVLPSALYARLKRYADASTRILNMYGLTETAGIVSVHQAMDRDQSRPTIPLGRAIPGADIVILDEHSQRAPAGVVGEMLVSNPAITREDAAIGGRRYYRTGDLARYLPDGEIEFVGRKDQAIKIKGHRVDPGEVESCIRRFAKVKDVAVEMVSRGSGPPVEGNMTGAAVTDAQLIAFIVFAEDPADGTASDRCGRVRSQIRRLLPDHMVPARFVELDGLPLLPNGKTDRVSLRNWSKEHRCDEDGVLRDGTSPNRRLTSTERSMAAIWGKLLKVAAVDADDNFFDLGGDSLLGVALVEHTRRESIEVSLEDLFQHQTLAGLAACADRNKRPGDRRPSPEDASDERRSFPTRVSAASLRALSMEALTAAGLEPAIAEVVTTVQLEASLRGQATHNIASIPRYARRIRSGRINARPVLRIIREGPTSAVVAGDNGPGQWVAVEAVAIAIEKAKVRGIGLVSVRESNHFGAAGHYPWLAAREGLIGLCTTNGPVILAPTGGLTATLGNNPLAVGIPSASRYPILLDATMSVAPRGRIGVALAEGQRLPDGWIYDSRGRPSTDLADLAAGLGVPIGGHKGYGLALIMEVLSGVLSGSGFGLDHGREHVRENSKAPDIGHFFLVVDPGLFMPNGEFETRVSALIEQIKSARRMEGVSEILVPGEKELRTREVSLEKGVELRGSEYGQLLRLKHQMKLKSELERMPAP